ncbi:UNVERIFIED_CONTAM: hypothetical protein B566_EDAN017651, partial [Ephemera danica]
MSLDWPCPQPWTIHPRRGRQGEVLGLVLPLPTHLLGFHLKVQAVVGLPPGSRRQTKHSDPVQASPVAHFLPTTPGLGSPQAAEVALAPTLVVHPPVQVPLPALRNTPPPQHPPAPRLLGQAQDRASSEEDHLQSAQRDFQDLPIQEARCTTVLVPFLPTQALWADPAHQVHLTPQAHRRAALGTFPRQDNPSWEAQASACLPAPPSATHQGTLGCLPMAPQCTACYQDRWGEDLWTGSTR